MTTIRTGRPTKRKHSRRFSSVFDEKLLDDYEEIIRREGRNVNDALSEHMQEYSDLHKDDRPDEIIDKWFGNPNFMASTAFYARRALIERFLMRCSPNQLEEVKDQIDLWAQTVAAVEARKQKQAEQQREENVVSVISSSDSLKSVDEVFDRAAANSGGGSDQ